ncbi:solute carrier family 22 member 7 [Dermacentor silvarum]|uniref:solute carrier family 22 member 7 n=1 Tax=Dermacentor silvarum TaxID=543639 RepID=UPI0018983883|nr:solute carrier family 22 member 7 [Dermacentor silvarum]
MDICFPQRLGATDLLTSECFDCQDGFGNGSFQRQFLLLSAVGLVLVCCHGALLPLVFGNVDHWCKRPAKLNISTYAWKSEAIPVEADGRHSRCYVYADAGEQRGNYTGDVVTCDEWDYDEKRAATSAVTTWNMVCHRRTLLTAVGVAQNAGAAVFLLVCGAASDLFGRMPVLVVSAAASFVTTLGGCLTANYVLYAAAQFVACGCVGVNSAVSLLVSFEVTVHKHRPLHLIFTATASFALADLWLLVVYSLSVDWMLKQVVFLAPTLLLLVTFNIAQESPRWLVAKRKLDEAEAVMLNAAKANEFSLPGTAYLLDKVKLEGLKNRYRMARTSNAGSFLLDVFTLRRRVIAMFAVQFSLTFAVYADTISMLARIDDAVGKGEPWFPWAAHGVRLLSYASVYTSVARFGLVTVLSTVLALVGVIHCLLSFVVVFPSWAAMGDALLVLSSGLVPMAVIVSIAYLMEVVPTAVRGGALGWALACGRVGAGGASSTFVLRQVGPNECLPEPLQPLRAIVANALATFLF